MKIFAKSLVALALAGSVPAFAHPGHPAANAVHTHGAGFAFTLLAAIALVGIVAKVLTRRS